MGINNEYRFGELPKTRLPRSIFLMKRNWKGTFNVGDIIPFYLKQTIVPGDTFQIKQAIVARMLTPITPTMDDLVLDVYYFSVPLRLVWANFKKFMGENENGAWAQTADLEIPQVQVPSTASGTSIPQKGTLWDYFGLPIGIKGADTDHPISVSVLPFRSYQMIYNYFFRNQSLIAPITHGTGDSTTNWNPMSLAFQVRKASRLPDYFSTALPQPLKNSTGAVTMPLGVSAPVSIYGTGKTLGLYDGTNNFGFGTLNGQTNGIGSQDLYDTDAGTAETANYNPSNVGIGLSTDPAKSGIIGLADLTSATASTIEALRLAAQTAMIYNRDSVYGTRYFDEILYGHYGVTSGAARFEKPQYLGGKRIPITQNQIAQTSETSNSSPLGNVAAFSLTADVSHMFTQSFTEHCILMGVMVIRQLTHTTQQGIHRDWTIRKRLDMWWHEFDHLGNQPIYNREIYADGSAYDNEVFGYQERYAEYRYEYNTICGEFRSTYSTPLDSWHYGDLYASLPVLSQQWIEETKSNVQRTIAVQNHDQFMVDTTLYIKAARPLPVSGMIGGLIDHF